MKYRPLWVGLITLMACQGGNITDEGGKDNRSEYCEMLEDIILSPASYDPDDPTRILAWAQHQFSIHCTGSNDEFESQVVGDTIWQTD